MQGRAFNSVSIAINSKHFEQQTFVLFARQTCTEDAYCLNEQEFDPGWALIERRVRDARLALGCLQMRGIEHGWAGQTQRNLWAKAQRTCGHVREAGRYRRIDMHRQTGNMQMHADASRLTRRPCWCGKPVPAPPVSDMAGGDLETHWRSPMHIMTLLPEATSRREKMHRGSGGGGGEAAVGGGAMGGAGGNRGWGGGGGGGGEGRGALAHNCNLGRMYACLCVCVCVCFGSHGSASLGQGRMRLQDLHQVAYVLSQLFS